jgi:hypothetical protein
MDRLSQKAVATAVRMAAQRLTSRRADQLLRTLLFALQDRCTRALTPKNQIRIQGCELVAGARAAKPRQPRAVAAAIGQSITGSVGKAAPLHCEAHDPPITMPSACNALSFEGAAQARKPLHPLPTRKRTWRTSSKPSTN